MAFLPYDIDLGLFIYGIILTGSLIFVVQGIRGRIINPSFLLPRFLIVVIISSGLTAALISVQTIPTGAYDIPWMRPHGCDSGWVFYPNAPRCGPRSIGYLGVDMESALMLNVTISIKTATTEVPVRGVLFLGHDLGSLYVAGEFNNTNAHPFEPPFKSSINSSGSFFQLLLDADNDGKLTTPESGVYVGEAGCNHNKSTCSSSLGGWGQWPVTGYFDLAWSDAIPGLNRSAWDFASNLCPQFQTWQDSLTIAGGSDYLAFQFSRMLASPGSCGNAMQIYQGRVWIMGFLIEFGYYLLSGSYQVYVGGWPGTAYPYLSSDSSWWPKLVIDMTAPPVNFTSGFGS